MSREEIEARKEEMRPWYWWGVPTFFRCAWNKHRRRPEVVIGSFRCPSGRLRTQVALVGGKAVGGALGRVL